MEENPISSMARTGKIIRRSIHTFLQHYQYFTSIATLIALPFSTSVLISQSLLPRSFDLFPTVYTRLHSVFDAAGFPPSSDFFSLVTLKLSQTISSSIITLPFSITFLLLAKVAVIHFLTEKQPSLSFVALYNRLLSTHLCNSFVIFSANATCFSLLFFAFNFLDDLNIKSNKWFLLLSAIGAVFYSIVLANALVICNLALVSSGMEEKHKGSSGFTAILRACVLIRGKTSTALGLAVPINLGLAAVEALFHFRIVTLLRSFSFVHGATEGRLWLMVLEGLLIAYLYSLLVVLDVIVSCLFYKNCKNSDDFSFNHIADEDYYFDENVEKLKGLEEFV